MLLFIGIMVIGILQGIPGTKVSWDSKVDAAVGTLYWPVRDSGGNCVTSITPGRGYNKGYHNGIDISNSAGCSWYAAYDGTVYKVFNGCVSNGYNTGGHAACNPNYGRSYLELRDNNGNVSYSGNYCNYGFGNGVIIQSNIGGEKYFIQCAHMNTVSGDLYEGKQIKAGTYLGTVGDRGFSFGTHAHFEVDKGKWYDSSVNNDPNSSGCIFAYSYKGGQVVVPVTTGWSNKVETVSGTNARLGITYNAGSSKYFGYVGLYINGQYACGYDPGYTGSSFSFSFDLNKDAGITLQPGKKYTYKFYVNTMSGDTFSSEYSFTAPGSIQTWSNKVETVSGTNAKLGITYNAGSSKYFGYVGLYVNGKYACGYDPGYTGSSYSFLFDLNKDAGITLQPGQKYTYKFYVNTMDGSDIFGTEYSFTAPGSASAWSGKTETVSETNAVLGIKYNAGSSKYFGWVGLNIWNSSGTLIGQAGVDPGYTGSSYSLSFNINNDTNQKLKLQPGQIYKYQFYVNTMDGNDIFSPEYTFTTPKSDNEKPVIKDAKVIALDTSGYTVQCKVTDNVGVDRVQCPTWTAKNDQDDIAKDWGTNSSVRATYKGDGIYEFRVNTSDHNYEKGYYHTHIYAYDKCGNYSNVSLNYNEIVTCSLYVGSECITVGGRNAARGYFSLYSEYDKEYVSRKIIVSTNNGKRIEKEINLGSANISANNNAGGFFVIDRKDFDYTDGEYDVKFVCEQKDGKTWDKSITFDFDDFPEDIKFSVEKDKKYSMINNPQLKVYLDNGYTLKKYTYFGVNEEDFGDISIDANNNEINGVSCGKVYATLYNANAGIISVIIDVVESSITDKTSETPDDNPSSEVSDITLQAEVKNKKINFTWNAPDRDATYGIVYALDEQELDVAEENNRYEVSGLKASSETMTYECTNAIYENQPGGVWFRIVMKNGDEVKYSNAIKITNWNDTTTNGDTSGKLDNSTDPKSEDGQGNESGNTSSDKPSGSDSGKDESSQNRNNTGLNVNASKDKDITTEVPTKQTYSAPKIKLKSVKNNKKKTIVVKWKWSVKADGYQISYAKKKNFSGAKKKNVNAYKDSVTIKKLTKGKTYYVKIRSYVKDDNGNKVYGKWSSVKRVKIKK